MGNPFAVAQKYLHKGDHTDFDPLEGPIIAVLIDSPVVGPVWFARSDDFKSGDGIPVFFMSEVPYLEKIEHAELRRRYEQKIALGGGRIVDKH